MRDRLGRPRFTLRYEIAEGNIIILSIQRERWQYRKPTIEDIPQRKNRVLYNFERFVFDKEKETQESKQFQRELGGMHPAEFLLSEFIWRQKKMLRNGSIFIESREEPVYKPLIERFFDKQLTFWEKGDWAGTHKLALNKKRVKQLLRN